jgi:nicotinic acid mononucleotide adenylyltransferase
MSAQNLKRCSNASCKRPDESSNFHQICESRTAGGQDWSSLAGSMLCEVCFQKFKRSGTLERPNNKPLAASARRCTYAGCKRSDPKQHGQVAAESGGRTGKRKAACQDDMRVRKSLENEAQDSKKKTVLVMHGSLNPVHSGHILLMHKAKAALELAGHQVERGVMLCTSEQWIHDKGDTPISTATRLSLMRLCGEEYRETHEPFALTYLDGSDYESSTEYLRRELGGEYIGADCMGSDVLMRHGEFYDPCVVVCRAGDKDSLSDWMRNRDMTGITVVDSTLGCDFGDATSTMARAHLEQGNRKELEKLCGVRVAAALLSGAPGV